MAKLSIKKDDFVMVIAGKDKGKTAHVLSVDIKKNRAMIEGKGITVRKKAVKGRKASDKSGIIDMPATIDISNLMPICSGCDKPTRVGHIVVDGKKQRKCIKCGSVLETKKFVEKKAKATVKKKEKTEEVAKAEGTEELKAKEDLDTVEEVVKTEDKPKATATKKTTATATAKKKTTATASAKKKAPAKAESEVKE